MPKDWIGATSVRDAIAQFKIRVRIYWIAANSGQHYVGDENASPEQQAYAKLLGIGARLGLTGLAASFALYWFGIFQPYIPLAELPRYWSLPVNQYLQSTNAPTGWGWLALIDRSDYLPLVPIAFLSILTLLCYVRVLPMFLAKDNRVFAAIATLQIAVLALAASGMLGWRH